MTALHNHVSNTVADWLNDFNPPGFFRNDIKVLIKFPFLSCDILQEIISCSLAVKLNFRLFGPKCSEFGEISQSS